MVAVLCRVAESGRVSLPAEFRKAMGLERGGQVVMELDHGELRIRTMNEAVARAQRLTRRLLGESADADVNGFLRERRREADQEP